MTRFLCLLLGHALPREPVGACDFDYATRIYVRAQDEVCARCGGRFRAVGTVNDRGLVKWSRRRIRASKTTCATPFTSTAPRSESPSSRSDAAGPSPE